MNEPLGQARIEKPELRHFTAIESSTSGELRDLLDLAARVAAGPGRFDDSLNGRLLINLFLEASTRTRVSFEIAARRMGMHVVNVSEHASSVEKGESLEDTFDTLQAMGPDCVAVRHPEPGAADRLADRAQPGVHVINAGDGGAEHPTQALLDALTLQQAFGRFEAIKLAIVGDVQHSRVARSDIALLSRLGVSEIRLAGPAGWVPPLETFHAGGSNLRKFDRLDEAVTGVNAIIMLRIQRERMDAAEQPDPVDYHRLWGLKPRHLRLAGPGCRVLHPGPMNRGVEIAPEVADGEASLIRTQVRNGVFARMAVLHRLLAA